MLPVVESSAHERTIDLVVWLMFPSIPKQIRYIRIHFLSVEKYTIFSKRLNGTSKGECHIVQRQRDVYCTAGRFTWQSRYRHQVTFLLFTAMSYRFGLSIIGIYQATKSHIMSLFEKIRFVQPTLHLIHIREMIANKGRDAVKCWHNCK